MIVNNVVKSGVISKDVHHSILSDIADFLSSKGFPNSMAGFSHLCCAVEKAVSDPDILNKETTEIYRITGDEMNISECHIERSLRSFSDAAFKNGIRINGELTEMKLKNRELIAALTEEYRQVMNIQ